MDEGSEVAGSGNVSRDRDVGRGFLLSQFIIILQLFVDEEHVREV